MNFATHHQSQFLSVLNYTLYSICHVNLSENVEESNAKYIKNKEK